jgi:small-conductance mechanosensitive channel
MEPDPEISRNVLEVLRVGGLFTGFLILAFTWLLVRGVTAAFERTGGRFVHRRLLLNQIATLLRFLLYIGGLTLAVGTSIHLSKEVVLALAGTAAVTIGFALKDLAASILAGVTIIIDRPFQVGDRVKFDTFYGEITSIGLRSVRILTLNNQVVTIPNSKFLTEAVASANHGSLDMLISLEILIAADQDIGLAKRLVQECMTSSRYVYMGKPWSVVVSQAILQFGAAVRLHANAHVIDVKYEEEYASDVTERVLLAFRDRGIAVPGAHPRSERAVVVEERGKDRENDRTDQSRTFS